MIRFLAEISRRFENNIWFTPSMQYSKVYGIYELDISPKPIASYWKEWGGVYDNIAGNTVELYFERFLLQVNTVEELQRLPYSIYVIYGVKVYINIPRHPWLYTNAKAEAENVLSFLSSALNEANPSKNIINNINTPVRLLIPSLNEKLSDNINGIILNQSFQFSLYNDDGYFDDDILWNLFNTPARIKKAIKENPEYGDFKQLRGGLIENVSACFDSFQLSVSDKQRSLDMPICGVITREDFPDITIDDKALNKNIPVVYGTKKVKLIKLGDMKYIAAEFVSEIIGAYDKEDSPVDNVELDASTFVITSTVELETAIITGYNINKIGEIIKDIFNRKTSVIFGETNFNTIEYNKYANVSPSVNIVCGSGTVNNAIQNALKNDMAFLIQQSDGRFTIRKYGELYGVHKIPAAMITKKPDKEWSNAQKNYFSSCVINYDFLTDDSFRSYLYDELEEEAEDMYRRVTRREYDTDLYEKDEVVALAKLLSKRYTAMKQTVKLALGIDTSEYELLDTVICDIDINGRLFTNAREFIIKEHDPAQDTLSLEEL
jgi:hypothetical protein